MKIKTIKIIGIVLFLMLFLYVLGLSILFWYAWDIVIIVNVVCIVCIVYILTIKTTHSEFHRFYQYTEEPKVYKKKKKIPLLYKKQQYEFSCGPAVMQTILQIHGITVSEDELYTCLGDKNLGTSHWEIVETLNTMFEEHQKPLHAKVMYYSNVCFLDEHTPTIVLLLNTFVQEGFSKNATYPHFVIITDIDVSKKSVMMINPSLGDGEIAMDMEEFLYRFYAHKKYLNTLEYKPTKIRHPIKKIFHWSMNRCFGILIRFAYGMGIIKPGTSIVIKSKE